MSCVWRALWQWGKALCLWLFRQIGRSIWRIMCRFGRFLHWLIYAGRRWQGARYADPFETLAILSPFHRGWLIAGRLHRLSEQTSYQSLLTVGGMGTGKTSRFVVPNLLALDHRSLVITDTSGEIYERCAARLQRRGYELQSFNLASPNKSHRYNPLAGIGSVTDVQQVAGLVIRSSPANANPNDPFWTSAAEKLLRLLIQALFCLDEPDNCNLARLRYWLAQIDPGSRDSQRLDELFARASQNDPQLWHDYQGFMRGHPKSLSSIVMTADLTLAAIADPVIARLTASNSFHFGQLRKRKTALFVQVRELDMRHYAFLLNLYFAEMFRVLLSERRSDHLPVYLLLDEFGQLTIPDFATFATTARKFHVAFWIFLQSFSQLDSRYGREEAQTILDGLGTKIFLPGMNVDTAEMISKLAGLKRQTNTTNVLPYGELSLLNPDEIVHLRRNEALMLHGAMNPIRLRMGRPRS